MKYIHIQNGTIIETSGKVTSPYWKELEAPKEEPQAKPKAKRKASK